MGIGRCHEVRPAPPEAHGTPGGAAALRDAVGHMQEAMDRSGAPVDGETDALIEHLMAGGTATGA
jgi:hypothetical protein